MTIHILINFIFKPKNIKKLKKSSKLKNNKSKKAYKQCISYNKILHKIVSKVLINMEVEAEQTRTLISQSFKHPPPQEFSDEAHIKSFEEYKRQYDESINSPETF